MRPLFRSFVVLLLGFFLIGISSFAQNRRFSLHIQGGGAGHEENNLKIGLASGFGISIPISSNLSMTAELDYWETRSRYSFRKLYNGHLTILPILIGLRYEFQPNAFFAPYVIVGGGYLFSKFRIGSLLTIPEVTIDQRIQSGWAGQLGVGACFALSNLWSFFSEFNYLLRTAPAQTIVRDMNLGVSTDDIWVNLHVVLLKFGFKFSF